MPSLSVNDPLSAALAYAMDRLENTAGPVAVVNATGRERPEWARQSVLANTATKPDLTGTFGTILLRATRQTAETLGMVAMALAHLAPSGRLLVAQENAHGAAGLEKHLRTLGSDPDVVIKHKCRVVVLQATTVDATRAAAWATAAALQQVDALGGLWSQPGLFSWDRADAGSRLLLESLPDRLDGAGADLGCGYGFLSRALVQKTGVTALHAIDIDARAVDACTRNLAGVTPSGCAVRGVWRDATAAHPDIKNLDWVVTNPPFHTQQAEDRALGQAFCRSALDMVKAGGAVYLVANRHMPYETLLEKTARTVTLLVERDGFKILRAQK